MRLYRQQVEEDIRKQNNDLDELERQCNIKREDWEEKIKNLDEQYKVKREE